MSITEIGPFSKCFLCAAFPHHWCCLQPPWFSPPPRTPSPRALRSVAPQNTLAREVSLKYCSPCAVPPLRNPKWLHIALEMKHESCCTFQGPCNLAFPGSSATFPTTPRWLRPMALLSAISKVGLRTQDSGLGVALSFPLFICKNF